MHRKNMAADSAHRPVSVAVIGGGPAGSAAAVELCRRGHSVVILEHGFYESRRMGESVPPSARQIISELGLPLSLFAENSIPCEGIGGSWGSAEIYEKKFIFNPYGSGWHVDRQRLDLALARAAETCGAELLLGAKILSCNATPEGANGSGNVPGHPAVSGIVCD
jgi:flavin-dependent dehydrogenase